MVAVVVFLVTWALVTMPGSGVASGRAGTAAGDALPVVTWDPHLPLVWKGAPGCQPIPEEEYTTLNVEGPPTVRPAEEHPDLNIALRGYRMTNANLRLVNYGWGDDPRAPQLRGLFADLRLPTFATAYRVYDWDWECDCRGSLLAPQPVTLAGLRANPGETIHVPGSGYEIESGYEVLVLYASEERITLKYTREDNAVYGYTLHVENVCVEPRLLALYRAKNEAGRVELPALRAGQAFGRARGTEIGVAIRDTGQFLAPNSKGDWWRGK